MRKRNFLAKHNIQNNKGFTMPELMVTALIFILLIGGLYAVLLAGDQSWQTNRTAIELQQELRKAMEWMKDDLRQTSAGMITIAGDGTGITFNIPASIVSGSIVWGSSIQFALDSGTNQLERISSAGTKVIAQHINNIQFAQNGSNPNILEVNITAQDTPLKGQTITYQLDFEVQMRN